MHSYSFDTRVCCVTTLDNDCDSNDNNNNENNYNLLRVEPLRLIDLISNMYNESNLYDENRYNTTAANDTLHNFFPVKGNTVHEKIAHRLIALT